MQGSKARSTTILGLDPGSRLLGYGLIESDRGRWVRVTSGTLRLDPRRSLPERLVVAFEEIRKILATHRPEHVAVEECFVAKSARTALVLGQVRGVLLVAALLEKAQVHEFAPRSVKLATVGQGGAAKDQVQNMIPRLIERCPTKLQADEADALAVAWCCANQLRFAEALAGSRAVS